MANQPSVDRTYSPLDKVFRASLGETGDYSGAKFDGDFSLSLEEAQARKHGHVIDSLGLVPGERLIDLGCGWGPLLNAARDRGIGSIGLTLSEQQAHSCRRLGFDVRIQDCRSVEPGALGEFDGAASLGAFEHFSSPAEAREGKQEAIYRRFFESVSGLIPIGRRFFLQTMVFGPKMLPPEAISLQSPRDSDSYSLALMMWGNPDSWLPTGLDQIVSCASDHFRLVSSSSGRLDYIETLDRWVKAFRLFRPVKYLHYAGIALRHLFDGGIRNHIDFLRINPNKVCFERELFEHYRIVFERIR